jgi:hypothetical protein
MLKELKKLVIKTKTVNIKVCPECWEPDQPQLQIGMYPVNDAQAVREPRPDTSYITSGTNGLQTNVTGDTTVSGGGTVEGGSRIFQWGWNPIGGASGFDAVLTPNNLNLVVQIGTVQIVTT